MPKSSTTSWQSVLQRIVRQPGERQRLIHALGINPMTFNRWLKAEYQPNRNHLAALLQHVPPQYRQELLEAIKSEHPNFDGWVQEENRDQVSTDFYIEILDIRATMIEAKRNREIQDKILKQVLVQLDPHRLGMAVTLVQCMPPQADGKIHSLRERIGSGSPPWIADLENLSIFLAMESLAGYVVQNQRSASIDDLSQERLLPAYQAEHEISAAAAPLLYEGNIAGCLLVSSTEIGHFTQPRMELLNSFSNLLSLGLEPSEYYPHSMIQLGVVRYQNAEEQRALLRNFRLRVQQKIRESSQEHIYLTYPEAEKAVWAEFEQQVLYG